MCFYFDNIIWIREGTLYAGGFALAYSQLAAAHEEKKNFMYGKESIIGASVLAHVSGMGENKLSNGKSLQGIISEYGKFRQIFNSNLLMLTIQEGNFFCKKLKNFIRYNRRYWK